MSGLPPRPPRCRFPLVADIAPAAATESDRRFEALVKARFGELLARHPVFATYLGLPDHDEELADGSRAAIEEGEREAERFLNAIEALDEADLSPYFRVERELARFATRRELFDTQVHRVWDRRVSATDEIGDGVFLLFARGTRPLTERLTAIAARLEQAPRHIEQQKTRLGERPPVRLWNEMELEAIGTLPALFDDVVAAARREFGEDAAETLRLEKASTATSAALHEYGEWLKGKLANATDDFALGSHDYDQLIELRAFDGLSTDDILQIGEQQLAENLAARARIAREIDPRASESEVIDRVKSDHPADFDDALERLSRGDGREPPVRQSTTPSPACRPANSST